MLRQDSNEAQQHNTFHGRGNPGRSTASQIVFGEFNNQYTTSSHENSAQDAAIHFSEPATFVADKYKKTDIFGLSRNISGDADTLSANKAAIRRGRGAPALAPWGASDVAAAQQPPARTYYETPSVAPEAQTAPMHNGRHYGNYSTVFGSDAPDEVAQSSKSKRFFPASSAQNSDVLNVKSLSSANSSSQNGSFYSARRMEEAKAQHSLSMQAPAPLDYSTSAMNVGFAAHEQQHVPATTRRARYQHETSQITF